MNIEEKEEENQAQIEDKNYKELPAIISNDIKLSSFDNIRTVGEQLAFAEVLIRSKLVPKELRTPDMLITVMNVGRALGIPAPLAVLNIHNIEGRPSLSVHAIGAILIRGGVTYKTIYDFESVYLTDHEGKHIMKDNKPQKIDVKTTIRFTRKVNGRLLEEDFTFSWKDAQDQNLTTRPNWVKMKKIMLWTRTFTLGAKRIAPDLLNGMSEISEAADIKDIDINLDTEGNIVLD